MVKIILDTKALLEYLAGKEAIVEKVKHYIGKEELYITAITLFEVITALRNEALVEMVKETFNILPLEKESAVKAREIYLYLEETRKPDVKAVLTAAIAIQNNAFLIAGNRKEYVDIPEIKLV